MGPMPRYQFICHDCKMRTYLDLTIDEMENGSPPYCLGCGEDMSRNYAAEGVKMAEGSREKGIYPYDNQFIADETVRVESRAHEDKLLKDSGQIRNTPSEDAVYRAKQNRKIY